MKKTKQFSPSAFIVNAKMKVSLMLLLMLMLVSQGAWALGGSGTSSSPYTIANAADLKEFADIVNGTNGKTRNVAAWGKLTADITLTSAWTAMGSSSYAYTGTFDGQGHKISGLSLTATAANAGFFGYVNGATIKNFSLAGSISSNSDNVGSVVGYAKGSSTIQDIVSTVNITMTAAKSHLGGIAGNIENGTSVLGCTYSGTLNAGSSTDSNGGIVGFANANCSGTIKYCFFNGTVKTTGSGPQMGGILGYTNDTDKNFGGVQNCYSCGTLTFTGSDNYANAIVGRIRAKSSTTINNTFLSGTATRACNTDCSDPVDFTKNKAITISVTAGANGSVSQSYVNPTSTTATQLQVVATPSAHYHFGSWSDSGAQTHSVGLTANVSLSASFAVDQHQITVKTNNSNYGTVTGGGTYDWNSKQTIKATAKTHYHFVKWNDGDTDASRSITVTGDATYTATFAPNQYTITVATNNSNYGTVSGGGTFDYNSTKTITATPKEHYHFVKWNDGDTNASRTITVTGDKTYTATFAPNPYTITVNVASGQSAMGTVSGGDTYDYGTQQTITATANEHYHFVQWNDGNTDATRTITVTGDKTYTATFAINQYTINFSPTDRGTLDGAGSYDYNSTVEISATPFTWLHFVKWGDGNTDNPRTITVTGNETYAAVFELHTYGDWITDKEPTCSTMGSEHCECTFDGCGAKVSRSINMVAHTCSDFDANGFGECSVCHAEQYERPERDGDIWQIRNAGQLYYYADIVNKYYTLDNFAELRNDIVVNDGTFDADGNFTPTGSSTTSTPRSWTPIGDVDYNREVYIEGYGHTISGLYFNDENTNYVGFVGYSNGCSIKNLGIINCYIKGQSCVGGISGSQSSYGMNITNCYVTGRISGLRQVGGICGVAGHNSTISKCWSDCIVSATEGNSGGICGYNYYGAIVEDCYSMGTVTNQTAQAGGISGRNWYYKEESTIRNCYSTATVSGATAGSICGINDAGSTITNCYSTITLPAIAENNGTAFLCESNVTAERLASGEIAYKLNGSVDGEGNWTAGPTDGTQAWYQKLGEDATPVLTAADGNTVYTYTDCQSLTVYTNDANCMDGHQWGDDHTCTVCHQPAAIAHTGTSGTCTWSIYEDGLMIIEPTTGETGTLGEWNWDSSPWFAYRREIKSVKFQGEVLASSCWYMFYDCSNLTTIDFSGFNTANVWDMAHMFQSCTSLQSLDLSSFNTANLQDMEYMFSGCSALQSVDLISFNTTNVGRMACMFEMCQNLATLKLSNDFVLNEGVDKENLFGDCATNTGQLLIYYVIDESIKEALQDGTTWSGYFGEAVFVPSAIVKDGVPFNVTARWAWDIPAENIVFTRQFTAEKPASAMLPFEVEASNISGATFYEFKGVKYENNEWVADMTEVTTVREYTPYVVITSGTGITFTGDNIIFQSTEVVNGNMTQTDAETGWSFVALNETKTWKEDDPELGKAYLVEENQAVDGDNGTIQIELVKIEAGTTLKAGRCYFVMNTMPTERGDINNDGRISIADLNLLIEILNGRATDTTGKADVDGMNGVTTDDIEMLKNIILEDTESGE